MDRVSYKTVKADTLTRLSLGWTLLFIRRLRGILSEIFPLSIDKLKYVLLSDFYSNLLTEKQREFLSLYYEEDLSLGEISEKFGISRQAVYDSIRSSEMCLERFENELGLLASFQHQRGVVTDVLEHLQSLESDDVGTKKQETIRYIKQRLHSLIDPPQSQYGDEARS